MERAMRNLAAAAFAVLLFSTAPGLAAMGRCYDAQGRAIGAPYDTQRPDRALIDRVVAEGGKCAGVNELGPYGPGFDGRGPGESYQHRDSGDDSGRVPIR